MSFHLTKRLALAIVLAVLGGCAMAPPKAPEEAVSQRATARWQALVGGDPASAYPYLSPGYRTLVSENAYVEAERRQPVVGRTSAEVESVRCETGAPRCDVSVRLQILVQAGMLPGSGALTTEMVIGERWILMDGVWYFAPKEIRPGS